MIKFAKNEIMYHKIKEKRINPKEASKHNWLK